MIDSLETLCFNRLIECNQSNISKEKLYELNGALKEKLLQNYLKKKDKLPPIDQLDKFLHLGSKLTRFVTPKKQEIGDKEIEMFLKVAEYFRSFKINNGSFSEEKLCEFVDKLKSIEELSLKNVKNGISQNLVKKISKKSELTSLEFTNCKMEDKEVDLGEENLKNLKKIKLKKMLGITLNPFLCILEKYSGRLKQLTIVEIDPINNTDSNCAKFLLNLDLKVLEKLEIDSIPQVKSFHWAQRKVEKLTEKSLANFIAYPNQLGKISLKNNGLVKLFHSFFFFF